MQPRISSGLARARSRRAALASGGALLAAAGLLAAPTTATARGTPGAGPASADLTLVQAFGQGSLFPTQGDPGVTPYTLTLWDAADRGLVYIARAAGAVGIAPFDALVIAIEAGERPRAALVVPAPEGAGSHQVWALRLDYAGAGSDPGSVTYQGEPIDRREAERWLGVTPEAPADAPVDLAGGYLLIVGLPGLDLPEGDAPRLDLG